MNKTIQWYNKLSWIYDLCTFNDFWYRKARKKAIEKLEINDGDVVVDLFCGTGVNIEQLLQHIGSNGKIVGIDGSSEMLLQTRKKINKNKWNENQIKLIEKDLETVDSGFFINILPDNCIPKVLITLGLSTLSNPKDTFDKIFDAFPNGTQFSILDGYVKKGTLSSYVINFIGAGSFNSNVCNKNVWELLKAKALNYNEKTYHPFVFVKCGIVVATGTK